MKELLYLCTKNVYFTFNAETYSNRWCGYGLSIGPVLANIFMVELEKIIIPKLEKEVKLWRRFDDDTI